MNTKPNFNDSSYYAPVADLYEIGSRDGTADGIKKGWEAAIGVLLAASGTAFQEGRDDDARQLRAAARRIQAATPPAARPRTLGAYDAAWKAQRELWEAAGCPMPPAQEAAQNTEPTP